MTGASPRRVLLIGGTSEIGLAILRRLAADAPLAPYLLGRDHNGLAAALEVLRRAGCADGALGTFDAADLAGNERAVNEAFAHGGGFDLVVLAVGLLGAQDGLDADPERALEVMNVNFAGCGSLMLASLRALRSGGGGTLVVLSSVAGERVRSANAVYGAAKAGLDALAQGLGDAVAGDRVRVLVVRPGFVSTRMTAGLPRAPLTTTPEAVADATVNALHGSVHTVWVPGILRYMFMILRHLPRALFRRLPL
jgi:decaprenylphospho-beta-D-erythro-pentofuranosid-2-ulose 2-reductase